MLPAGVMSYEQQLLSYRHQFDLSQDIDLLLSGRDNTDDGEEAERPVSRLQFYVSDESESSSSSPSSPDTVILNDHQKDGDIILDELENLQDSSLPDLAPITQSPLYYEASVIVSVVDFEDNIEAFNGEHKFPDIYEVLKILNVFQIQIERENTIIVFYV